MAEAERENVIMRKGVQYDRLIEAARACETNYTAGLQRVIRECEAELQRQADEHARQWNLK
jgi:hypothetical protein